MDHPYPPVNLSYYIFRNCAAQPDCPARLAPTGQSVCQVIQSHTALTGRQTDPLPPVRAAPASLPIRCLWVCHGIDAARHYPTQLARGSGITLLVFCASSAYIIDTERAGGRNAPGEYGG